jgi:dihydroflavonol-4-reductase
MRALVTGANGLIGANLIRELIGQGVEVRAMVRATSDLRALSGLTFEKVTGDVRDAPDKLAPLCAGCDLVFHTAAQFTYSGISQKELEQTAVTGTRHLLEAVALAGIPRIVVTSSSVVFGSSLTQSLRDEISVPDKDFDEPPYVLSKIRQDKLASHLGRTLGLEVVFVCPTMSVGPNSTILGPSNGLIVAFLNDPVRMTYPGGCNIVSVRDIARGHWLAATHGSAYESYILGSENLTWAQIHGIIAELCGIAPPRVEINHTTAYLAATYEELRAQFIGKAPLTTRLQAQMIGRYYWYDHAKAKDALGFAPMSARAALAEACAWLAMSPHISREVRANMTLNAETHAARHAFFFS